MLELKNITKTYPAGSGDVQALKGINTRFRDSEFVSVLGPSGCGKTTLLNIIGGLDRYTSGDFTINGRTTKEYRDRDWDTYRNHSVGFVFQTYNLIPHQSVLQNVELALTLSGVGKAERRRRAREALETVGLGDQLKRRPGEMSGGQMQRVAIARAIVNNPDIVLADEPTGALDSETSIQVMDILKEISKDRLVIMVTHNPDLAERYSTRIVRMLDGKLTEDSDPVPDAAENGGAHAKAEKSSGRKKKPSLSVFTSFGLSLKNLFTKKGRTVLTSFAGSIGIIGIALIYAVSAGMTGYINSVQEDTLSSYPLSIEATNIDATSLLATFIDKARSRTEHENDAVYQKELIYDMMDAFSSLDERKNDLKAFKTYIESELEDAESKLSGSLSAVQYSYLPELNIYTKNIDGEIIRSDTGELMTQLIRRYYGMDTSASSGSGSRTMMSSFGSSSLTRSSTELWHELLSGNDGDLVSDLTEKQYDLVYGNWPSRYDEIVLFVDKSNELNDLTLYALGLKSADEIDELMSAAMEKRSVEFKSQKWEYEEICGLDFRLILDCDCFTPDESTGTYKDLRDSDTGLKYLYDNALVLHVTGIAKPAEDAIAARSNGGIGYTYRLTDYILEKANSSDPVIKQTEDPGRDIFTGLPFRKTDGEQTEKEIADEFRDYISGLDETAKVTAYIRIKCIPDPELVSENVAQTVSSMSREDMENTLTGAMSAQTGMSEENIRSYISAMSDEELGSASAKIAEEQFKMRYAAETAQKLAFMKREDLLAAMDADMESFTDSQCALYHGEIIDFSDSTYEDNLIKLGSVSPDDPSAINLYASSFANKDLIIEAIDEYNKGVDELKEIRYTDYVGLLMSSITTIINAITYVLIAFVAVSLVVSSIMIGVITLISVQERTKEIGILRSIGASKRNVSTLFNAETLIIGLNSGIFGVAFTYLLCFPINAILHGLTGISNLSAYLPWQTALILIAISALLNLFAGIIPSRSAAKKDPVVALRTE